MSYSFKDYQKDSRKTALYPTIHHKVLYPTLGLAGESGEVLDKIKKIFRDKEGKFSKEDQEDLTKELGDVLWYISQIATELDINLEDIAKANIEKLYSRLERNKLAGDGDNR